MSTLIDQLNSVRKIALKEISGLITLLGTEINSESKQQVDPTYAHFGLGKEGVFNLRTMTIDEILGDDNYLDTNGLARIVVWNGEPENPMGASHTWDALASKVLSTDDLMKIHAALEAKLNVMLHRD